MSLSVRLHEYIERVFYSIGLFVGRHRHVLVVITLCIVALALTGTWKMEMKDNVRQGYSPDNGPARHEAAVYREYFNIKSEPQGQILLLEASDRGSLTRPEYLNALVKFLKYLKGEFNVTANGQTFSFADYCKPRCEMSQAIIHFIELYARNVNKTRASDDSYFQLDFPEATLYGSGHMPLYSNLFGVQTHPSSVPNTDRVPMSNIVSFDLVALWFDVSSNDQQRRILIEKFESDLWEITKREGGVDRLLAAHMFGDLQADAEVMRGGQESARFVLAGVIMMGVFVLVSVCAALYKYGVLSARMLLMVPCSVSCPMLSVATTFGVAMWIGQPINAIMCLTPVLVIGIGVDDAFLVMHSWLHHKSVVPGFNRLPVQQRVAQVLNFSSSIVVFAMIMIKQVLRDVGPSVSITSLTNVLAFTVGATAPIQQIRVFSIITAVTIAVDFCYEMTFFTSCMAIIHSRNEQETPELAVESHPLQSIETDPNLADVYQKTVEESKSTETEMFKLDEAGERPAPAARTALGCFDRLLEGYCRLLCSWLCRVLVLTLMLCLWYVAGVGLSRITPTFSAVKTFTSDSPLRRSVELLADSVWPQHYGVFLFVNSPPDLANTTDREHFMDMVEQLESQPDMLGEDRHLLWLRPYLQFVHSYEEDTGGFVDWFVDYDDEEVNGTEAPSTTSSPPKLDYQLVPEFLDVPQNEMWKEFVHWDYDSAGSVKMGAFGSILSFVNMSSWTHRANSYSQWRVVVDSYPQFNATLWENDAPIFDLILSTVQVTVQSVCVTIGCMLIVCAVFVPSLLCVGMAVATISSIVFVMTGSLSWWGADLDPLIMLTILMSCGFSVDYTAHVTYHYYTNGALYENKQVRLRHSLRAVAFPMIQAGLSTLLCITPMVFVNVYAFTLFVKSMWLVVCYGLLHGLLVLPCALATLPHSCTAYKQSVSTPTPRLPQHGI